MRALVRVLETLVDSLVAERVIRCSTRAAVGTELKHNLTHHLDPALGGDGKSIHMNLLQLLVSNLAQI